ncbi:pentatricopeptide repeat-containing protein At5g67570, chloroplastic isoform X3 [Cynara cardunculus var. scolymus]|uniref:pentatricopeptide repeat-containing protein At5g67570, chloroplastic isoform X3 n=1 Tax=Cynara cardunculus var. scolymus TaxID=59895 RepID=UPI000D629203|nr:pentatricopeptide repeat-containing protein At5g67570, chloroplastic isoform X3 [Cynara cardunculus var. scolymus]
MDSLRLRGPPRPPLPSHQPDTEAIKRNHLENGVSSTPKMVHTLRKKQVQRSNRRRSPPDQSPEEVQEEEVHFQTLKAEFKTFNRAIVKATKSKQDMDIDHSVISSSLVGKPWERLERAELMEYASANNEFVGGENLKYEHLDELSEFIEKERDKFKWILEDDVELEYGLLEKKSDSWVPPKRKVSDGEAIRFLVDRLSGTEPSMKNWKFSRMMKQSGLQFTEDQLLKIVGGLGDKGQWRHALSVVKWVYSSKEHRHFKSRFVYTKLLAVLGKARRSHEALQIFNLMRADHHIYPDMAAYHCIAIALGQSGLLKELVNVIDCMKQEPSNTIKKMRRKNWDPVVLPDLVVYNAVLNACTLSGEWKGVSWVFEELRRSGLKPNGATYGLAMEVMMASGKYELVHEYFEKMKKSGNAPKALTYKVLVKAFSKEGKVNEAVEAVRDMEQKGVVGEASVYCELAFCLCFNGMWQEAILEIRKMKRLHLTRPLVVTFTGLIVSSLDGGHIAKELFEDTKRCNGHNISLGRDGPFVSPDAYTYGEMLRVSASAHQWEYFDYVYKEMIFSGYQLDQKKHAFLLVEASRAGKTHLLEHAFDVMLEGGEIPPSSFFVEIICRAMIQDDFDRAITILNSMAHAPFLVREKEWRGLFEEYKGKITRSHLRKLLDKIGSHDIAMEASAYKLSRLLQSLCGSKSNNANESVDDLQESASSSCDVKLHSIMEHYADELESVDERPKSRDYDDYDSENDLLGGELGQVDESKRHKLPSADGILENWKESMMKDGIFLPFQTGIK